MRLCCVVAFCSYLVWCTAHTTTTTATTTTTSTSTSTSTSTASPPVTGHLVISNGSPNVNTLLLVSWERFDANATSETTTNNKHENDFIGLFAGLNDVKPLQVAMIADGQTNGTVEIFLGREPGTRYVKFVRLPNIQLAASAIQVYSCKDNCSRHGVCVRGNCLCNAGYSSTSISEPSCDSIDASGFWVEIVSNGNIQTNANVSFRFHHNKTALPIEMNGIDYLGFYKVPDASANPNTNAQQPEIWKAVPFGKNELSMIAPKSSGTYIVKVLQSATLNILFKTNQFVVFPGCSGNCSGHGRCVNGFCVCALGFDLSDCSRGPGMVSLIIPEVVDYYIQSSNISVNFSRVSIEVLGNLDLIELVQISNTSGTFDEDQVQAWTYAVSEDRCGNSRNSRNATARHRHIANFQLSNACDTGTGFATFNLTSTGTFEFRYLRSDRRLYASSRQFQVFPDCGGCNNQGQCVKGKCICGTLWKGDHCEIGNVPFTVSSPVGRVFQKAAFNVEFSRPFGSFGSDSDLIAVIDFMKINDREPYAGMLNWTFAVGSNVSGIVSNVSDPNSGAVFEQLIVSPSISGTISLSVARPCRAVVAYIVNRKIVARSKSFEIDAFCPANCSGNGKCDSGFCRCNDKWEGDDCARMIYTTPKDFKYHVVRDFLQPQAVSITYEPHLTTADNSNDTSSLPDSGSSAAKIFATDASGWFSRISNLLVKEEANNNRQHIGDDNADEMKID